MNIQEVLEQHKVYIESFGKAGAKADLRGASLYGASLYGADLRGADLRGADLPEKTFLIAGEKYVIQIINGDSLRAGCQSHSVESWRKFTKKDIADMDGKEALRFYPRLLDILDFYLGVGERPDWVVSSDGGVK